jgi:hypothetical protein
MHRLARPPAARPSRPAERRGASQRAGLALALALAAGCSQRALVGRDDALDAATYDTAPFDGPGVVEGRLHSHAVFNSVDKVYWFGGANDPSILELYIYEDDPTCDDVSKIGWLTSSKVRPGDLMGLTIGGNQPGVYEVSPEKPPAAGHAYLLHVIDQTDPVIDSEGLSGSVTITSVKPGQSVSGAFGATFSTGTLKGSFNATWCPTGVGL